MGFFGIGCAAFFIVSALCLWVYRWAQTDESLADVARDAAAKLLLWAGFGCKRKDG